MTIPLSQKLLSYELTRLTGVDYDDIRVRRVADAIAQAAAWTMTQLVFHDLATGEVSERTKEAARGLIRGLATAMRAAGDYPVVPSDAYNELTWLPEKYVFWLTEEYREAAAARASA